LEQQGEKTEGDEKDPQDEKELTGAAKVFDILFTVFVYLMSAAILVGAVLFSFSTTPDKSVFGYRYYTVLTPSMSPTYEVGDMIFVKISKPEEINVNDVITFNPSQDSDAYLTHRVIEKYDDYQGTGVICFRTKGDANDSEDSFLIDGERVIGKVTFGIPVLGFVVRFVQMRWYIILPIVIMIAVFLQLLKRYFSMSDDETDEAESDNSNDGCESETKVSGAEEENPEGEPKGDKPPVGEQNGKAGGEAKEDETAGSAT
jgi:signal peptidase